MVVVVVVDRSRDNPSQDQAIQKIHRAVTKFLEFRAEQEAKFEGHGCQHGVAHKLGDVTTINCTMLSAGVTSDHGKTYALNVIPMNAEAGFDIRIPVSGGFSCRRRLFLRF